LIYILGDPCERQSCSSKGDLFMGDRSPKSVQKQAKQKQTKSNTADQKKQQAAAAKQGGKK
jgi:hypothetical protein